MDSFKYIETVLSLIKDEWKEEKVFIGGECDSNQTDYEYKSNRAQIGVVAKSDIGGRVLLALLRIVIDDRTLDDLIEVILENYNDEHDVNEERLEPEIFLKELAKHEEYVYIFDGDKIEVTLVGWDPIKEKRVDEIITKKKSDIKLYTKEIIMFLLNAFHK